MYIFIVHCLPGEFCEMLLLPYLPYRTVSGLRCRKYFEYVVFLSSSRHFGCDKFWVALKLSEMANACNACTSHNICSYLSYLSVYTALGIPCMCECTCACLSLWIQAASSLVAVPWKQSGQATGGRDSAAFSMHGCTQWQTDRYTARECQHNTYITYAT